MTFSRLSRETRKLLGAMPQQPTPSPPRRITRASLARFAYSKDSSSGRAARNSATPDIEEAIPDVGAAVAAASRKRKRTTTITPIAASAVAGAKSAKRTVKEEVKEEEAKLEAPSPSPPRKQKQQRKPARKTVDPSTGQTTVEPPSDWEAVYDAVKAMRAPGGAAANAAVDTMGCERLALTDAPPLVQRFQTLVALMLSSQTKDTTNAVAMRRLQTELPPHAPGAPGGLTLENVLAVDPDELNRLIWAVGFHNNKTRYIKRAAEILRDEHSGDVPDTIAGLTALPGVGPKMAYLCLSAAWGRTEGIGVDVHVHRITNLWGWHGGAGTKNPEETRARLESWLPRDRWREINSLLVGLGQTVCLPVGRRCGECDLGLRGLCRAAERKKVIEGRKAKAEAVATTDTTDGGVAAVVKVKEEEEELAKKDVVVNESI